MQKKALQDSTPQLKYSGHRGMAQSGLARLTGGQKVAGSNPVAPTFISFW